MNNSFAKILLLSLLILLQQATISWKVVSHTRPGRLYYLKMAQEDNFLQSWKKSSNGLKKVFSLTVLASTLLSMHPQQSDAVPSGSRSGGSSFRSTPSYRSSTRLNSGGSYSLGPSYRSSTSLIPVPSAPFLSPFPFGFGFPSFGFGFGWGVSPFSLFSPSFLLAGGLAYATFLLLSNRIGGSDFDLSDDDAGSLGLGTSVVRLQIALDEDWSEQGNLMESLALLAAKANGDALSSRSDLSRLLSETSLALMRKRNSWTAAAISGERFGFDKSRAEPFFQRLAIAERAKFDQESNSFRKSADSSFPGKRPTKAVVSIIAAIRRRSNALQFKDLSSFKDVLDCLQSLAAEAKTDDGENVLAVEVLWTPSQRGDVLSERDLVADYPELRSL